MANSEMNWNGSHKFNLWMYIKLCCVKDIKRIILKPGRSFDHITM